MKEQNGFLDEVLENLGQMVQVEGIEIYCQNEEKEGLELVSFWPRDEIKRENTFSEIPNLAVLLNEEFIMLDSMVVIPLSYNGRVYGIITFREKKEYWAEDKLGQAAAASRIVKAILQNKLLEESLEKGNEQLTLLNELYEELNNNLLLNEVLEKSVGFVKNYFGSSGAAIYLAEERVLALQSQMGDTDEFQKKIYYSPLEEWTNNVMIHQANSPVSKRIFSSLQNNSTTTTIPIFSQEEFVGVLVFNNPIMLWENDFLEDKENLLLTVGYLLGNAIEKAFLYNKALESSKLKSLFVANMSHEIRTPLNAIIGFSELLTWGETLNERQEEYVKSIQVSSQHLLGLIENILDLSKIEAGKLDIVLDNFSLKELLEDLQDMFAYNIGAKGLDFTINIDPSVPKFILSDQKKIRQVLVNLLGNAFKFTHQGKVQLDLKKIYRNQNVYLLFSVEDTGIGIAENKLGTLFQYFSQGDLSSTKKYGGTGLGLAISKKIIEMLGGEIAVKSQVGMGSQFSFILPLTSLSEETERDNKSYSKKNSAFILIVDDNEMNRKIIRYMLEQWGYNSLDEATNGYEALEKIKTNSYELVLMDVQMPEMDGLTAVKSIRSLGYSQLKIIALSAYSSSEDREKAIRAGCDGYLTKPVSKQDLLNKVEKYLGAGQKNNSVSTEIFFQLQQEFIEGVKEKIIELDKAWEAGEQEKIRIIGHNLKGSGKMFNYPEISLLGEEIESYDLKSDKDGWKDIRDRLEKILSKIVF